MGDVDDHVYNDRSDGGIAINEGGDEGSLSIICLVGRHCLNDGRSDDGIAITDRNDGRDRGITY